ncbi:PKD domain-containing protein [Flavitalea antarctica]
MKPLKAILLSVSLLLMSNVVFSQVATGTVIGNQTVINVPITASGTQAQALIYLPDDYAANPTKKYPLLIFLHGAGEGSSQNINQVLNTGLPQLIAQGLKPYGIDPVTGETVKYIIVSPHAANSSWSFQFTHIKNILPNITSNYRVDVGRVIISGLSAGGYGTWTCISDGGVDWLKNNITAIVPLSTAEVDPAREAKLSNAALAEVAVWAACGTEDSHWPGAVRYQSLVQAGNPTRPVVLIPMQGADHNSSAWNPPYTLAFTGFNGKNLWSRMLDYKRLSGSTGGSGGSVNAGTDQTITLPASSINLAASAVAPTGLSISTFLWTKVSGPGSPIFRNPNAASTAVDGLTQGTYIFRVAATSNQGTTFTDDVQIIVNVPPVANAGADQSITLPINVATLDGTQSADPDGSISAYNWSQIQGPSVSTLSTPLTAKTGLTLLQAGVYKFKLLVTDNRGAAKADTVQVTVNATSPQIPGNQKPVVNAGANQTITLPTNRITVIGSAQDTDGSIVSVSWSKISGPSQFNIASPNQIQTVIENLQQGVYRFQLEATDNSANTNSATVDITVNAASSVPSGSQCGGKRIYIVPGSDRGKYISGSNFSYQPGDTFVLKAANSPWSYFSMDGIHGTASCPVVIVNEGGQVIMTNGFGITNTTNLKIAGTGSGDQYGFQIKDNKVDAQGPAVSISGKSSNIEVTNLYINHKEYGFWIKNEADCDVSLNFPNWTLDNISVHDCLIREMDSQGFYMGSTDPNNLDRPIVCNGVTKYYAPSRLSNIRIYNNIIDGTGRPGIQLSGAMSGNNEIYNNTVRNTGLQFDDAQGTGISLGGYTRAYVHHNNIKNTYTWGIASLGGSGLVRIEDNTVDSSGWVNNRSLTWPTNIAVDTRTTSPVDSTTFWIKNNVLGAHRHPSLNMTVADLRRSMARSNIICNNTQKSNGQPVIISVEAGIVYSNCTTTPPVVNQTPVAIAGSNQTVTLPTNSITVKGSGTDADGSITSYEWTKIAGPTQFSIVSPSQAQSVINNLVQGIYQFQLKVTDNHGASASNVVQVEVKQAPVVGNQGPIANAGQDIVITLPTNSARTDGSKSVDPDGSIVTYEWSKIDGPSSFDWASNNLISGEIVNLVEGTYTLQLKVTDNKGASSTDQVQIKVNPAPLGNNRAPVAKAGMDQKLQLPNNSVRVDGGGSYDTDGLFIRHRWSKLSGPSQYNITDANAVATNITGLVEGVYVFRLVITDDKGATGTDDVEITIDKAIIQAPPTTSQPPVSEKLTVNAGSDIRVILPRYRAILQGSATNGTDISYRWTKFSGPDNYNIYSAYSSVTELQDLRVGVYTFRLTATDGKGNVAYDDVVVTVSNSVARIDAPTALSATVWPNPSKGVFNLNLKSNSEATPVTINIYNQLGLLIRTITEVQPNTTITVGQDLMKGQYYLQIKQGLQSSIIKLIKQ